MVEMTGPERRHREPALVGDLIDGVLGRIARSDVAPVIRLRREWDDIAGRWAATCRVVAIRGDALSVEVDSGMDASMLRYESETLLQAVRRVLGDDPPLRRLSIKVAGPREGAR
jgi:hypothetical protein